MHSGVRGQTGSAQIWSTIHQQLRVPVLPPDVSLTDWASCPQQVTLVMMRPVVSTAQSMTLANTADNWQCCLAHVKIHIILNASQVMFASWLLKLEAAVSRVWQPAKDD